MLRIIIAVLTISGCASTRPYKTPQIQLDNPKLTYSDGTSLADIDRLVRFVVGYMSHGGKYRSYRYILLNYDYVFLNKWLMIEDSDNGNVVLADGYTDTIDRTIYVYRWHPCLAASSIIHEMIHAIGYKHDDKLMFQEILPIMEAEARERFCTAEHMTYAPPPLSKDLLQKINKRQRELKNIK